jgi:ATP-dependent DNA ligase
MSVIDILEDLESTSGSNAKRDLLSRNKEDDLLKRAFVAAQDPYTVYYVNKFKMPKPASGKGDDVCIANFLNVVLPPLAARRITGNEAKAWVEQAFANMDERQQKWCQRIILKNLRVGVQESTLNKVWPGIVKSFSVALAETLKSGFTRGEGIKLLEPVEYPVRLEPKLDGLRCIAVKQNGIVTFYTRNGTVLETLPKIKAALESATYDNIVLDGEAMGKDWNESASVLMAKKTQRDDSNIVYNIFDALKLEDWVNQENNEPYAARVQRSADVVKSLPAGSPVRQVPGNNAKNEEELKAFFAQCMNDGFEGIMLKRMDTPYKFKRSDNILKLKPVVTYEGVIVGHYEGRRGTKREGLFGGFHVVLPNGIVTRVGGGFTDTVRSEIQLDTPDAWLGKVVECEAQPDPLTKDGLTADGKMRFPVYLRTRDVADVDPKILAAGEKFDRSSLLASEEEA